MTNGGVQDVAAGVGEVKREFRVMLVSTKAEPKMVGLLRCDGGEYQDDREAEAIAEARTRIVNDRALGMLHYEGESILREDFIALRVGLNSKWVE